MNKENESVFKSLSEAIVKKQSIIGSSIIAYAKTYIGVAYSTLEPVVDEKGKKISAIDPKKIGEKIEVSFEHKEARGKRGITSSTDVARIEVVGKEEEEEARKQYALSPRPDKERNPFLGAYLNLSDIRKITDIIEEK